MVKPEILLPLYLPRRQVIPQNYVTHQGQALIAIAHE
jgi:hypothetical protein